MANPIFLLGYFVACLHVADIESFSNISRISCKPKVPWKQLLRRLMKAFHNIATLRAGL